MKKYLLNIGAVATAIAPIATIVSCKEAKTPVVPSINVDSARADKALKLVKESEFETEMNKTLTPEVKKKSAGDVNDDQKTAIKTGILSLIRNKMDGTEEEKSNAQTKIKIAFETSTEGTTLITNITVKDIEGTRTIYNNGFNKSSIDVQTTNKAVGLITNAILDKLVDKTKFASAEKSKITKTSILKLDEIKNLTNEQKALITVKAEANDANGTLKVVIEVKGGKQNTIDLVDFMTQGKLDIKTASEAVNALKKENLPNGDLDKTKKASEIANLITNKQIRSLDVLSKLSPKQKELITVLAKGDDKTGVLTITISVEGGKNPKVITIEGFLTTANDNIAKAEAAIKGLKANSFDSIVDKNNKASTEKANITNEKVRELPAFNGLLEDQKNLIEVKSVIDYDASGTLKIIIEVKGGTTPKNITLNDFAKATDETIKAAGAAISAMNNALIEKFIDDNESAEVNAKKLNMKNLFPTLSEAAKKVIKLNVTFSNENKWVKIEAYITKMYEIPFYGFTRKLDPTPTTL